MPVLDSIPENDDVLQCDTRLIKPELFRCATSGFTPQSGEVDQTVTQAPEGTVEQIVAFDDQEAGWMKDASGQFDSTMDLVDKSDTDLGAFLGRPVKIDTQAWVVGQPLYKQINPWELFVTHPAMANKLAHYELLRGNLNVKVVISGTGFHYGRTLVSYNPLNGYDEASVTRNFIDQDLIAASQRPCIFLNPTDNSGGQMKLPFFFLQNYMSLSKGDYRDMGVLDYKSFGNLLHANGGDDPVYITTYAWMTETSLTMPTSITSTITLQNETVDPDVFPLGPPYGVGNGAENGVGPPFSPQSGFQPQAGGKPNMKKSNKLQSKGNARGKAKLNTGDEYGQGIISAPASAVAKAAGMLTSIPFIEPYARATQMVASKVGQVASIFGYSRPAVVSDFLLQKPSPTGNFANVDASDAVNRLTLDSKQEITIDSRTVGLDGGDQMAFDNIQTRESYLTSFTMSSTDAPDAILWNSYVTPNLFGINNPELHMTPMAMLAQYFSAWQGTIKFRFQIVKSNFHKGRILVRYDPRSHSSDVNYTTNYSRVIDLATEDDFEIEIGWGQNVPFLGNQQANVSRVYYGGTRLTTDSGGNHNGVIEVNVVNSLVAPAADSDIRINVFVSAGDDMKWGRPNPDKIRNLHYFPATAPPLNEFQPQSGMGGDLSGTTGDSATDRPTEADNVPSVGCPADDDHMMDVFFGEMPVSLREIFRRYVFEKYFVPTAPTADGALTTSNYRIKSFPFHSGDDPDGLDVKSDGLRYNQVQTSPIAFFAPCFAGWRGSLRHKWVFSGESLQSPLISNYGFIAANGAQSTEWTVTNDLEAEKFLSATFGKFSNGGSAGTNLGVNNTIETEMPYYNGNRFSSSRILSADNNSSYSYQVETIQSKSVPSGPVPSVVTRDAFYRMCAAGEDFTLFFWTGVPIMYNYSRTYTS
ncbi:hypothetical protein 3 [Beihai picorna-like virus 7]|uniref:hypothetical protein 3 n=1 Tax=Beihai picorna-like virus 7 TaxID=1922616 RepID=UPI00090BB370|nr:hypothetical protein 3 [Beihai picorna-like virus 7]APG76857.1 hypothetical protein 3 [Beihai picorna-like virus 7]